MRLTPISPPPPGSTPSSSRTGIWRDDLHPPVSRVDPAGLLGVVVDVEDFPIVIPRLLPAVG